MDGSDFAIPSASSFMVVVRGPYGRTIPYLYFSVAIVSSVSITRNGNVRDQYLLVSDLIEKNAFLLTFLRSNAIFYAVISCATEEHQPPMAEVIVRDKVPMIRTIQTSFTR